MALQVRSVMGIVALSVVLGLAALTRIASGQSVDARAINDKSDASLGVGSGGAQSRNIYSQKHLSTHRMMHFGKRPLVAEPPMVFVPPRPLADYPVYQTAGVQDSQPEALYSYNPLEQIVGRLPSAFPANQEEQVSMARKQLIEVVTDLLELTKQQQLKQCVRNEQLEKNQQQQQRLDQQQPATIKFMKLMNSGEEGSQSERVAPEFEQQSQEKRSGGEQPQQQNNAQESSIILANRSLPDYARSNMLPTVTRAHLNTILFGRRLTDPPATLLGLGNYIKKAEPSKMTFMHFG